MRRTHVPAAGIALILVAAAVSAGISSQSSAALVLATVLMLTGVVAYKFLHSAIAVNAGVQVSTFREFLGCVIQNLFRFGIGAIVIAWMAVSALWFFGA